MVQMLTAKQLIVKKCEKNISDVMKMLEEKNIAVIPLTRKLKNMRGLPDIDYNQDDKESYEEEIKRIEEEKKKDPEQFWYKANDDGISSFTGISRFDLYLLQEFLNAKYRVYVKGDWKEYTHIVISIEDVIYDNGYDSEENKDYYINVGNDRSILCNKKWLFDF